MMAAGRCRGRQDYTLLWSYDLTWVSCNPLRRATLRHAEAPTHLLCLRSRQSHPTLSSHHPFAPSAQLRHLFPTHSSPPSPLPACSQETLSVCSTLLIPTRGSSPLLSTLPHLQHLGAPSRNAGGVGTKALIAVSKGAGYIRSW